MKRQRSDIGRVTTSPGEEVVGFVVTTYETSTGELSIAIQGGELILEITLEARETKAYLESNHLLYAMLEDD